MYARNIVRSYENKEYTKFNITYNEIYYLFK